MARPELRELLDVPGEIPRSVFFGCFQEFLPMIFARYDLPSRTRVVSLGDKSELDGIRRIEEAAPGTSGAASFIDQFTIFGAVRRATGAFYADDMRLCPHRECPEYGHNYCNSWIFIHKTYQECGFLRHFGWLCDTFRKVQSDMDLEKKRAQEERNG